MRKYVPTPASVTSLLSCVEFLSAIQSLVPGYDRLVELDHERGAFVPVSSDLGGEAAVREHGLHDAGGEGGAVQAAVLFGHGDVRVDQRLFLDDVIRLVVVVGLFQFVGLFPKQRLPHIHLEERGRGFVSTLSSVDVNSFLLEGQRLNVFFSSHSGSLNLLLIF